MGNSERIRIAIIENDARWRSYLSALLGEPVGKFPCGSVPAADSGSKPSRPPKPGPSRLSCGGQAALAR
jgi:hypothetical protein